ncbi:MAG: TRAP transporter large permease [Syntrophomonadaceae bacterium]|nr:TRAP transporter large permease [Syntrophomonadaceae bacterium]
MLLIVIFMVAFIALACLRVPIPFAAGMGAMLSMVVGGQDISSIPTAIFGSLDSFPYLAIPAFIYAGDLMTLGGISRALMSWVRAILGRIRGSVGATVVVTSALFGTISGSSVATVSAIGSMMVPEMLKAGYEKRYATALVAASGFIGILIPPSIPGIVYAMTAAVPVAEVWLSTAMAGIMIVLVYVIYNRIFFAKQEILPEEPFTIKSYAKDVGSKSPRAIVAILMPLIIFVGVYGGILTPTEAGAVAVFYGFFAGWVIYPLLFKDKDNMGLIALTKKSAITSAGICLLIAFAGVATKMFTFAGAGAALSQFMLGVTDSPAMFLLIVNVVLILVGMFMETNTSILLLGPILIPAAQAFGIDPIHFGAVMLLNLEIGMITPPFACNLFVACRISGLTMDKLLKPILGFIACCIPVLLITTYFPISVMWLVNLMR